MKLFFILVFMQIRDIIPYIIQAISIVLKLDLIFILIIQYGNE